MTTLRVSAVSYKPLTNMELESIVKQQSEQISQLTDALGRFLDLVKQPSKMVYLAPQGSCGNIENLKDSELDIAKNTSKIKRSVKRMAYLIEGKLKPEGTIRQRKDGRWEIRYMENGIQKSVLNRNQTKCLDLFSDRLIERMNRPKDEECEKFTLFDLIDKWYVEAVKSKIRLGKRREKDKLSKSYVDRMKGTIENHIKKHFPNKYLDNLSVFELENSSKKIEYSRTRENADSIVNMALVWAHKKGLTKHNIVEHFDMHKHEREQGISFSRIDQERILEYAKQYSKFYFHFMVYFYTGCRPSELREIRHCDFDFENKTIFIDGTKTKTSSRKIPLFAPLHVFKDRIIKDSVQKVFTIDIQTLREKLHEILISLNITRQENETKYTLKSTRHSFATRLKENGIDIKTISMWMGHTNIAMTDNYSHVLNEFEQMQAEKYNKTCVA